MGGAAMKTMIALLLSLQIGFSSVAHADDSVALAKVWRMVGQMETEDAKGSDEDLETDGQIIADEVYELSRSDFNEFLFKAMNYYVSKPESRSVMNAILTNVEKEIRSDIEAQSPQLWQSSSEGIVVLGAALVFLRGGAPGTINGLNAFLNRKLGREIPNLGPYLERSADEIEAALSKVGLRTEFKQNAALWVAGPAIFDLIEMTKSLRTYRIDPLPGMISMRANSACKISIEIKDQNLTQAQLEAFRTEAAELRKEDKHLENIYASDSYLRNAAANLPPLFNSRVAQLLHCKEISTFQILDDIDTRLLDMKNAQTNTNKEKK
jgi:hypothetical protein